MIFGFYSGPKTFVPNELLIVIIAFIVCGVGTLILYILKKCTGKKGVVLRCFILLGCFFVQFYLFWKTSTTPGWDANIVVRSAIDGFIDMKYYSKLPNNLLPAVLMRIWVVITDVFYFIFPLKRLIILNIIFVNSGLFFMYLSVKRVFGIFAADRALLISIPLIAFSPWLATPYTDTMGVFFTSCILYCIIRAAQSEKTKQKQLFFALAGFALIFAAFIKATAAIIMIALFLVLISSKKMRLMFSFSKNIFKNSLVAIAFGALISYLCVYALLLPANTRIEKEHPTEFARGILYYLDHGVRSQNTGIWNGKNYEWTMYNIHKPNYEEMAMQRIVDVLKGYGVQGTLKHFYNKLLWAGTDGVFAYGIEGAFYADLQDSHDTLRGKMQDYIYHESYFFQNILSQFLQAVWLIACLKAVFCVVFKNKSEFSFLAKLAVGGLFLYLMIFENRSRYVFLYTPIIIFTAECKAESYIKEVTQIFKGMFKRKKLKQTHEEEKEKSDALFI